MVLIIEQWGGRIYGEFASCALREQLLLHVTLGIPHQQKCKNDI